MSEAAKPKIMFVINSLRGGGAEKVMATLLEHSEQWREHYSISIALLDREEVAFAPPDWVIVHQLDCRFRTIPSLLQLRRLVGRHQPALTLSFLTRSNIACWFAMLGRGRPWIISERTNTATHLGNGPRGLATKAMVRAIYPRATRVIAVSQGVAANLAHGFGVPPGNIEVIANPVDAPAIRAASEAASEVAIDEPYVIALGRLVPVKNYALLVRAFAQSGIPGRLVIGGDGPERPALLQLAQDLGVADRILLPGFLKNPYPLLRRAQLFALSSNTEGFPNALLEALVLAVPVVATDCRDGPAEILAGTSAETSRGVTVAAAGVLTPVGDVGCFARALRMALEEPLRSRLVAAGQTQARAYSPDTAIARYWSVIETALASRKLARRGRPGA